ncbi:unnamed protein product [Nyctereutes procyonoides]|uniref:DNA-binding protein inhibitor ID-2 n=1 Tax=Nyctereutes procyonoides TaxID=34880 RepID=A0A811YIX3_NYCPR|nr:unnamed protein product [Nyctereutes procyonoides]
MRAFSPVRSVRKNSLLDHSLIISRNKTLVEDQMSLLYIMNDGYSRLKELVPSSPQNKVSKMEILQQGTLGLQIALDSHSSISEASRTSLTTLNTDISILSSHAAEFPPVSMSNDSALGLNKRFRTFLFFAQQQ